MSLSAVPSQFKELQPLLWLRDLIFNLAYFWKMMSESLDMQGEYAGSNTNHSKYWQRDHKQNSQ